MQQALPIPLPGRGVDDLQPAFPYRWHFGGRYRGFLGRGLDLPPPETKA
jgi:hypothetical protein